MGPMARVEILTGRERRRTWTDEDKLRLLAEAGDEGISLAAVARRHDLCAQQLYAWRSAFRRAAAPTGSVAPALSFLPVEIKDGAASSSGRSRRRSQPVEVALANGRRLRVDADIDPAALRRLVQALEQA